MRTAAAPAVMLRAFSTARRLRRGVALLACLAVVSWTLLAATHWHDHDDAGTGGHAAAECVLCLGVPTGAAPPQHSIFVALATQAGAASSAAPPAIPAEEPPSSYRSRAPPAA